MSKPTTMVQAEAAGYTRQVVIEGDNYPVGLGAFIKPHAKLDRFFEAFDSDDQCMVTINGRRVTIRDVG